MSARAPIALLVLVLALGLSACGGGDDESTSTSAPTSADAGSQTASPPGEGEGGGEAGAQQAEGEDPGSSTGSGGGDDPGEVDLTTDPASIKRAIVTAKGAVQTLPPSAKSHETAQENSYGSIRGFGEETAGSEATDITFALAQYLDAKMSGDWATACARLYGPLVPGLEKLAAGEGGGSPGCPAAFAKAMERVPASVLAEQAKIDVSSVRRGEEDRAFVIYKTPGTLSADMPMFLEDGVWKVGAIEAYALTPEQVG